MFSFALPKFAALQVSLPTGGVALFVHMGEGRFLSKVPPIVLAGVTPVESDQTEGLPVGWDASELAGDKPAFPTAFVYDVGGAQKAVEDAAAGGDTFARLILDELEAAQRALDARAALGVMDPLPAIDYPVTVKFAEAEPGATDPTDQAAAEGVGSGA